MKPSNLKIPSEANFWAQVKIVPGKKSCWLWIGTIDKLGYGRCKRKCLKEHKAHRISWVYTVGPVPKGKKVLHRCDVRNCVRPDHLFIGTQRDNVLDCIQKGRAFHPSGEDNPNCKLNMRTARRIRKRLAQGLSQDAVAKEFGLGQSHISRIKLNLVWPEK